MQNQNQQTDDIFMTVDESAALARSTAETFYVHLCKSGTQGGRPRKRFPQSLYVKFGRKTLFIKQKFVEWLMNGAKFEE